MFRVHFIAALLLLSCGLPMPLIAQAVPTASRLADLQAGLTFSYAKPGASINGLTNQNWYGYGAYADLDLRERLGLEFDVHQVSGSDPILYERTYEIGPRLLYPIHQRYIPYVKAMYGRGVFNFAGTDSNGQTIRVANLAYNIQSFGGGLDLKLIRGLNLRVFDFEYQRWPAFPPAAINPKVVSFGVAYHFHGNLTR